MVSSKNLEKIFEKFFLELKNLNKSVITGDKIYTRLLGIFSWVTISLMILMKLKDTLINEGL